MSIQYIGVKSKELSEFVSKCDLVSEYIMIHEFWKNGSNFVSWFGTSCIFGTLLLAIDANESTGG